MTIAELEKKHGVLAEDRAKYPVDHEMEEEAFLELISRTEPEAWRGCNHEDRIAFLEANGYEVTHENMLNADLSVRPAEDEAEPTQG